MSTEFYWIAVAAVSIMSAARITRLAVIDKFPPVKALRTWYENKTDGSDWQWLTMCGYCFSFWAALLVLASADLSGVLDGEPLAEWMTPAWWIINGAFAVAYASAIVMAYDGSDTEGV